MSDEEIRSFLEASQTIVLCSIGREGVPHPMPMWYAPLEDGSVVMTTYARSQKVRNLERDPRVSLLVEDGTTYRELRGVVLYGRIDLVRDTDRVLDVLMRVTARRGDGAGVDEETLREALRAQAAKRVAMHFRPTRVVSWDHRKLGGVY
jgi:PPOX class probable F420-dependent enzyme